MLESIVHPIEKGIDNLIFKVKKQFNLFDPIFIYPYRSYGFKNTIILRGRVLEREGIVHSEDTEDSFFKNLYRFYKRYESDEIPDVKLEITYRNKTYTTTTDDEGFYQLEIPANNPEDQPFWDHYQVKIIDSPLKLKEEVKATGEIMLPDSKSNFGVISDVDDTILESNITNTWQKITTLAFKHVGSRVAFPGVAALYRGLVRHSEDKYENPLWFVSGSSWNLYDLLDRFCSEKEIPKAPFLLREMSIEAKKFIKKDSITYKLSHLRPLMKFTDPIKFILIGDSGQKDPEIYQQLAEEFPGRIKAIYIRDVTPDKRDAQVNKIAEELKKENIDMILAEDSLEAAKHAFDNQWIEKNDLEQVKKEAQKEAQKEK